MKQQRQKKTNCKDDNLEPAKADALCSGTNTLHDTPPFYIVVFYFILFGYALSNLRRSKL